MYVIVKDRLFHKVGYTPNPAQRKIHAGSSRFRVVAAGRRLGKSTAGGHELLPEAYKAYMLRKTLEDRGHRMEFWITGPTYTDAEKEFRAFYNACRKLEMPFDRPGTYYDARGGDLQVSLWGGRFKLVGQSAGHPENLVGEGLHGVVMAEAAKMKRRIWEQYVRATLADFKGWGLFNSTPEGKNWFYDLFMKGIAGEENWASLRFPAWINRAVYPLGRNDPEIVQLKRDLSSELFAQEIEASFSEYVGRVFKEWDEEHHVRKSPYRRDWPLYIATDYGWTNPNVALFIQVDPFGRVYVISEYYQSHRDASEFADDLLEGVQDARHPAFCRAATHLYPDPEDPGASDTLARKLGLKIVGGTGGEQKNRLELTRKYLKDVNSHLEWGHPERVPLLQIDGSCKMGIHEMDAWRYPDSNSDRNRTPSEKPLDKDNHWPEALGRFLGGHFGTPQGGGQSTVRKAKFRRR